MAGSSKPYTDAPEASYTLISGKTYGNYTELFDGNTNTKNYNNGYFEGSAHYVEFEISHNFYFWCITSVYSGYCADLTLQKWNGTSYETIGVISRSNSTNIWYKNETWLAKGKYKVVGTGLRIDTEWFFEKAAINRYLFLSNSNKVYTYTSNTYTLLGDGPATITQFENNGLENISNIPIKSFPEISYSILVHSKSSNINLNVPKPINRAKIIKFQPISLENEVEKIDSLTLTGTNTNASILRILVSTDNTTWHSYYDNTWNPCSLSVSDFKQKGMTLIGFNNLNDKFNSLIFSNEKKLYLAFYIEMGSNTDILTIDALSYQVDMKGSWKIIDSTSGTTNNYKKYFTSNYSCRLEFQTNGIYKINY